VAEKTVYELVCEQLANDVLVQARASNQAFISNMAGINSVHARCAQVIDKRISEFDLEKARAQSTIDPVSQSYWLNKTSGDSGNVQIGTAQLLEVLRQVQAKK
jgi:hypothetical protein